MKTKGKKQDGGIAVWGVAVVGRMAREGLTEKMTFE